MGALLVFGFPALGRTWSGPETCPEKNRSLDVDRRSVGALRWLENRECVVTLTRGWLGHCSAYSDDTTRPGGGHRIQRRAPGHVPLPTEPTHTQTHKMSKGSTNKQFYCERNKQIPTYIDGTKAKTINQRRHQYTAQQTIDWRQGACGCWKTQMTRHLTCGCIICQHPGNHSMTLELQGPCCTSWAEPS